MQDEAHMRAALALARRGLGSTWPNPAVGCVLVRDGRVVGRGVTAPGGRPHAERVALDMAGELARGATAYVTLDKGLQFLLTVGGDGVLVLTGLKSYLNFVTLTLLTFGIGFLFPVFVVFLNVAGVLPLARLRAWRRGMVVGIAAAAHDPEAEAPATTPAPLVQGWTQIAKADAGLGGGSSLTGIAADEGSAVLVGGVPEGDWWSAAIWWSDDGRTWHEAEHPAVDGEVFGVALHDGVAVATVATASRRMPSAAANG